MKLTARQQGVELTAAKRQLKREVGRRETVQQALDTSEHHYRQLLAESRLMQEHLRLLSHEILNAQEEERKRISRELHDEIGQMLTAINVRLGTLKKEGAVNARGLKHKIASTQRLVERSMSTVHRFAHELRPPLLDDLGLVPALHAYMKRFTKKAHVAIDFRALAAVDELSGGLKRLARTLGPALLLFLLVLAASGAVGIVLALPRFFLQAALSSDVSIGTTQFSLTNPLEVSGRAVYYPWGAETGVFYGGTFQGTRKQAGFGGGFAVQDESTILSEDAFFETPTVNKTRA